MIFPHVHTALERFEISQTSQGLTDCTRQLHLGALWVGIISGLRAIKMMKEQIQYQSQRLVFFSVQPMVTLVSLSAFSVVSISLHICSQWCKAYIFMTWTFLMVYPNQTSSHSFIKKFGAALRKDYLSKKPGSNYCALLWNRLTDRT